MKVFEGIVVSTGMNKTVVVEVFGRTPHPLYKKLIKRSKKYKVDNTGFEDAGIGTIVRIIETRPISKDKYFKITGVIGLKQTNNRKPATTASTSNVAQANAASRSLAETPADAKALTGRQKKVKKTVRKAAKKEVSK